MTFPANVIAATPMAVKVEKQDYVEDLSDVGTLRSGQPISTVRRKDGLALFTGRLIAV